MFGTEDANRMVSCGDAEASAPANASASLDPRQENRVRGAPESLRRLLRRVFEGKASPRSAIKSFCQSCMGFEDYKAGIRGCTALACPLWAYRPYQERKP